MSSTTQKMYYNNNCISQKIDNLYDKDYYFRKEILDYYSICMPVEYELFNYVKTLIKKNKFNSIDIDVFDVNVGKYIKKQQYPNSIKNGWMNKEYDKLCSQITTMFIPTIDNIWCYMYYWVECFYLKSIREKIKQSFPELPELIETDIEVSNIITDDMVETYLKTEQYKQDRRTLISNKKEDIDIFDLEKKYKDNKDELKNILKNTIDLNGTIKKFAWKAKINETLHICCNKKKNSFDDDDIINRFKFKKTEKCLMCYWTAEHFGEITDTGKFRFNRDKLMNNEYGYKLDKLFNMYIGKYSFTITIDFYLNKDEFLNNNRFEDRYYQEDTSEFFTNVRIGMNNNKLN